MRAGEVAGRLGFGEWGALWALGLEAVEPVALEPLTPDGLSELLVRLGVGDVDVAEVVASAPRPDRSPEWWWLLERSVGRLVATMGDAEADRGPWPDWVGVARSPEQRCFIIHVFAYCAPFTLAWHGRHGVADDVAWDSLNDLARHMEIHRRMYGVTGVDAAWWMTLPLRAELFEFGRLQFNRLRFGYGDESPPWYPWTEAASFGPGWRRGDACLGVHIPETGPLTPKACDESVERAREFFDLVFPVPAEQGGRRLATCWSWLLDDQLASWLPEESNIMQFQRRFELVPGRLEGDRQVISFVFRRPVPSAALAGSDFLEALPQRSRLEHAIVSHLRGGGHWYSRSGWFDISA